MSAVGSGARGVADVRRDPGARLWGVAYRLSPAGFRRLDATEGVGRGFYRRVPVLLRLDDADEQHALTYYSPRTSTGRRPSRRYLGLLIGGARHHLLPDAYVERLRRVPTTRHEDDRQLELFE